MSAFALPAGYMMKAHRIQVLLAHRRCRVHAGARHHHAGALAVGARDARNAHPTPSIDGDMRREPDGVSQKALEEPSLSRDDSTNSGGRSDRAGADIAFITGAGSAARRRSRERRGPV